MAKNETDKKITKQCAICGKDNEFLMRTDKTYDGGHYFCKLPGKGEYWECEECYRGK